MSKKVLGKNIEPKCEFCLYAVTAADGTSVLCEKKGVRAFNDACKKFEYDPLKRTPNRPAEPMSFSEFDFQL